MTFRNCGLLSLVALLVFLTACSGTNNQTGAEQGGGQESGANDKPELSMLGFYAANLDPNSDLMASEVEKVTGYKVNYSMLPQDRGEEKLNLEVASGSDYDILTIVSSQFYNLVAKGALQPLDELLNEYGQDIKDAITPESWQTVTYDGKIYGIPYRTERPNFETAIFYRQDILDELELPVPRTADEFYSVLQQVKAAYPNMIPYTDTGETIFVEGGSAAGGINVPTIYSAFGLYTDWSEIDGELVPRILQPGMKEYIGYMNKLYHEGLIDQDLPINKLATKEEKFTSGRAFAMSSSWIDAPRVKPNLLNNVPEAKIGYLDPLEDDQGNAGAKAMFKLTRVSVIPKSAKHAEDAMKFMNIKMQPDNFTYLTLGTEGETFTVEEGKYLPINPLFTEMRTNAFWYMNGMDEHRFPDMWLARLHKSEAMIEAFDEINANFEKYKVIDPISLMPPLEGFTKNISALTKMEGDYYLTVLLGDKSLEDFSGFLEDWKKSGGTEMVETVNEWYASNS